MIAVATLGCDRKAESLHSWDSLFHLEGDYSLYFNYEAGIDSSAWLPARRKVDDAAFGSAVPYSFDVWTWNTASGVDWRSRPKFDQDQARLAPIVNARSMAIEYAMQTNASHLLFIDADIIPPKDIIPKLLETNRLTVGGLVHGRGDHAACPYIFGEKRRFQEGHPRFYQMVECEHGNIGFCMIARRVFEQVRFRYGTTEYPDGRNHMVSDDPAYHLDAFLKFHEWHYIRMDVEGKHIGDLKASEAAQY